MYRDFNIEYDCLELLCVKFFKYSYNYFFILFINKNLNFENRESIIDPHLRSYQI